LSNFINKLNKASMLGDEGRLRKDPMYDPEISPNQSTGVKFTESIWTYRGYSLRASTEKLTGLDFRTFHIKYICHTTVAIAR